MEFVTKLDAARRQLDAAIRMALLNEDALAIHTVAAAAYRILRDLKQASGMSEMSDFWKRSLYNLAQDFLSGRLESVPPEVASPALRKVAKILAEDITDGLISSPKEVELTVSGEQAWWAEFNEPANFLKHADRDPEGTLSVEDIENATLILMASSCFSELSGDLTDEMYMYTVYELGSRADMGVPWWSSEENARFRDMSPSLRRRTCLSWLRKIKKEGDRRLI